MVWTALYRVLRCVGNFLNCVKTLVRDAWNVFVRKYLSSVIHIREKNEKYVTSQETPDKNNLFVEHELSIYFKAGGTRGEKGNWSPNPTAHCVLRWGSTQTFLGNQDATVNKSLGSILLDLGSLWSEIAKTTQSSF